MTVDNQSGEKPKLSAAQQALLQQRLRGVAPRGVAPGILRRTTDGPAPLSLTQQSLWFLDRVESNRALYVISNAIRLQGPLNTDALDRAFGEVVRRHEVLRTRFKERADGQPEQIVEAPSLKLAKVDLTTLPETERQVGVERLMDEETRQPFDLESEPPVRAKVLKLSSADHWLIITVHHIVYDGWSEEVLMSELAALYNAFASGQNAALPELPIQYGDFSAWQQGWATSPDYAKHVEYWRNKLAGASEDLQLPSDRPRPAMPTMRGGNVTHTLSADLLADLRRLNQRNGATLFMTLLAAFKVLLARYTGQEDLVVGTPVTGRSRTELEKLIGYFVNMLVLRTNAAGNPTFEEWLQRVRETVTEATTYSALPFDKLVEELRPVRVTGKNPIFQVGFVFQAEGTLPKWDGLVVDRRPVLTDTSKFDVTLFATEETDGLRLIAEYSSELFNEGTIGRLLAHLGELLRAIVANPTERMGQLSLLSERERQRLFVEFNQTRTDYPRESSIQELFEAQATQTPEAIALVFNEQKITYRALNERANRLAHALRQLGVAADMPVGTCMERSVEMIVGLLAILKAGGAYLPLDAELPQERVAFMLSDAKAQVLLTNRSMAAKLPAHGAKVVYLDSEESFAGEPTANPIYQTKPENLAYIIYTSGSTGAPKGTLIPHRAVVRLVRDTNYANFGPDEVFLQFAPLAFDASTFEIWGPLLNGGKLVIMPPGISALEDVGGVVSRHGVTTLWLTAGLFHVMVEERVQELKSLRQLLAGGDVLSVPHVKRALRALPNCKVINGYGPTENTTFTCCHTIVESDTEGSSIPIGRPISNTTVYILDSWMQPVPVGVPGELYTGGDGLARGYLNQPELTREKFIRNPFGGEGQLYKTGDVCRWRNDGVVEFLGRRDHQVKIRGFRIELEEIESVLNEIPGIRGSCVVARAEGTGKQLVGYYAAGAEVPVEEVRGRLRAKLPEYMVPAALVRLEKLPLTANGKVNRAALPASDTASVVTKYEPPVTATERTLAKIWEEVLRVERVGRTDNFFERGGHSLLGTRLMAKVRGAFNLNVPLRSLFEQPTVSGLARAIDDLAAQQAQSREKDMDAVLAELEGLSDEEAAARLSQISSTRNG